jgi:hypothetical protein
MNTHYNAARKLLGAVALAGAGLVSFGAQAAPIIEWEFQIVTEWVVGSATFTAGDGTRVENTTELSWGETGGNLDTDPNGNRSGLLVDNTLAIGSVFTDGPVAPTTVISHINNPIDDTFATLLTTELTTSITLTAIDPNLGLAFTDTIDFLVRFTETPNSAPCGFPVDTVCDDIFVLAFESLNNSFSFEGNTYFISLVTVEGALLPLGNSTCAAAGAPNGCFGFTTPEGARTDVGFGILITTRPVGIPEPGIVGLLGLGLLGLVFSRRRRSA